MFTQDRVTTVESKNVEGLLRRCGLRLDETIDETVAIERDGQLVATGSRYGTVIKCLAVLPELQGEGLAARIVSELVARLAEQGEHHQFIYTKPGTAAMLCSLGFTEVARVEHEVVLLEGGMGSIADWCANLRSRRLQCERAACVVVNANPLTRGHLHVLNHAHLAEGALHILVVSTDRSLFPTSHRLAIIEEETANWPRTVVHEAGDYIVSMATFPAYFTREEAIVSVQARLDVAVFCRHVAPALKVTARYVGEEPYCPVTNCYNEAMRDGLPKAGISFTVIPRLTAEGTAISASHVRQMLREGATAEDVKPLVAAATYRFLKTRDGAAVIDDIRRTDSRH